MEFKLLLQITLLKTWQSAYPIRLNFWGKNDSFLIFKRDGKSLVKSERIANSFGCSILSGAALQILTILFILPAVPIHFFWLSCN